MITGIRDKIISSQLIVFRWLIFVTLLFYCTYGAESSMVMISYIAIGVLAISNILLAFLKDIIVRSSILLKTVFCIDITVISLVMYISGNKVDMLFLYSLVIMASALFRSVMFVLFIVIAGFLAVYGYAFNFSMLDTATLLRLPLFIIMAGFANHLSRESYLYKEEQERADTFSKALIDAINSGVICISNSMEVVFGNQRASEYTGFVMKDLVGKDIRDIDGLDNLAGIFSITLLTGEEQVRKEVVIKKGDGKDVLIGCTTSILRDKEDAIFGTIAIFRDISEIIKARKEREHIERLALIGESTTGISHEIKNPLSVISGLAQNLVKYFSDSPEKVKEYSSKIVEEIDHIDAIIKDITQITRSSKTQLEEINISSFIDRIIGNYRYNIIGSNTEITSTIEVGSDYSVFAAKGLLEQLLINLMKNAAEALAGSGGEIHLEVSGDSKRIKLVVTDNGPGISDDVQKHIFDPFFTTKKYGTGLGLSICRRIVELHKGDISIVSRAGYTNIEVSMPVNCELEDRS